MTLSSCSFTNLIYNLGILRIPELLLKKNKNTGQTDDLRE